MLPKREITALIPTETSHTDNVHTHPVIGATAPVKCCVLSLLSHKIIIKQLPGQILCSCVNIVKSFRNTTLSLHHLQVFVTNVPANSSLSCRHRVILLTNQQQEHSLLCHSYSTGCLVLSRKCLYSIRGFYTKTKSLKAVRAEQRSARSCKGCSLLYTQSVI